MDKELVIDKQTGYYMRTCGTERERAANSIRNLYTIGIDPDNKLNTYLTCSGMNSIYIALRSVCDHLKGTKFTTVLYSSELYCDTRNKIIKYLAKEYIGIDFVKFDVKDNNKFKDIILQEKFQLGAIFMESVSNPSGFTIDWNIIKTLSNQEVIIIIDNTWLTPLIFNPFKYDAAIVVESCSKYLTNGKCISGHVTISVNHAVLDILVSDYIKIMGIHV